MIVGEIVHKESYYDFYPKLLAAVQSKFPTVESGVQGDAWIWIVNGTEKVALDTFSAMQFQIKSGPNANTLLDSVIACLNDEFSLYLYDEPIDDGYDEFP